MKNAYDLYNLIGKNLKKIRTEKLKITQEQLAEKINLTRGFISHIESEKVEKGVSLDTLFWISQEYNIDIREFFSGYEKLLSSSEK